MWGQPPSAVRGSEAPSRNEGFAGRASAIDGRVIICSVRQLASLVVASCLLVAAAHACDFKTEPAGVMQFYRSQGWKMPDVTNGKISAPIVFQEPYPKDW
jgi:hypothetical protein